MNELASIQHITALNAIDGSDRIEVAIVNRLEMVVQKGQFQVNDLCVCIIEGSIIPVEVLMTAGFWDKQKGIGLLSGGKGNRVKTIYLRQQISQGLALSMDILDICLDNWRTMVEYETITAGYDVTELLGVDRYAKIDIDI